MASTSSTSSLSLLSLIELPSLRLWTALLPLLYLSTCLLLRSFKLFSSPLKSGSITSDVLAQECVALIVIIYLSASGFIAWFELFNVNIDDAKASPFFGYSSFVVNHIMSPITAYQGWNSILSLILAESRSFQMFIHHLLVFILSLFGYDHFLHYWAIFFFGIVETSNIPLTIMNIVKLAVGEEKNKYAIYNINRNLFAISFIVIRLIFWPYYFYFCIEQAVKLYMSGELRSSYFYVFTTCSSLLTLLQLFWGVKIFANLLSGGGKKSKSSNSNSNSSSNSSSSSSGGNRDDSKVTKKE